ncbi:double-strand break repair protein AddB [Ferruginivarius sediminum]|uniref:Double-strand break repair protein AddB n=1 Tax=Ferruginivarius sediminum TaxID=2661937 RepID=A0A369T892_9PROT|nr:double-strand break repair protein AddB [Ferruginivarius sediminum]RDD60397.1 double-strand break repair protein AddB [Ferruginivarius sediminum]
MTSTRPAVHTIPPGVSFVDALARGLYDEAGGDPLALSRVTVLLPTRRACRTLHEAFLRLSGGAAMLLPRMLPLGDLDAEELVLSGEAGPAGGRYDADIPPALPELRRQLLLTRLIDRWGEASAERERATVDQAARLAGELARLLDQVETEGLSFDKLRDLVPAEHARHWQITLEFLDILTAWWPQIEGEEGAISPAARRRRLMQAWAEAWRSQPPSHPIVAAGSTGSIPATADLLHVVAGLPPGRVVLPGLDTGADAATWTAVKADPTHPQHNMARLLDRMKLDRADVRDWPAEGGERTPPARSELLNLALKPAAATPDWRDLSGRSDVQRLELGLGGLHRLDCPGAGEEASAIALMLRQALEVPGRTAALVTPDRGLARRVASELKRWGLTVDDSAGMPLRDTAPGTFLRLTAQMLADGLAPLSLLAALKHPLAAGGQDPGAFRARVRALEVAVLRGPRPGKGFAGLLDALPEDDEAGLRLWLENLRDMAAEAEAALATADIPLADAVEAHMRFAEALAATDREPGPARLWAGDAGETAADFASELTRNADAAPVIGGTRYPALLDGLMAGREVRPRYGGHPRLAIWGPLEARMQRADLLILGGLNEGTWPAESDPGPWLSRPMRAGFGLPPVERRIGLMAHDFAQAASASEVVLTRATRVEGAPSVPSRWLLRLDAVLDALGLERLTAGEERWLDWARQLDTPARSILIAPPEPRPPRTARPTKLSVTRVEMWMRDPYALYAERILKLRPLDPLDQDPGAAEHGTLIHKVLERFVWAYPNALPDDPETELLRLGREAFDRLGVRPGVRAFWWPRFARIAEWLAAQERARRAGGLHVFAERKGHRELPGADGRTFTLTAKADRIERGADGRLAIIDYKTGGVPSEKSVRLGFSPQLPLEAAIAAAGAFADVPTAEVGAIAYWRLTGGNPPGEIRAVKGDPGELAEQAFAGLQELVTAFEDPQTPYRAVPRPAFAPRYSDYRHLSRVQEWSAGTFEDEG